LDGGVNVKALFRRGLARKGMGKLDDAKKGEFSTMFSVSTRTERDWSFQISRKR